MTCLVDLTQKALLVLRMDTGVFVDMLHSDESDDPTAPITLGCDFSLKLGLKACSFMSALG